MAVRRLAAALLLGISLAACADDPQEPSALPTLSADASTGASRSASPEPTGIDAPTPEGAADFARYFYAQVELAYQHKDPEMVAELSAPGCETCNAFVDTLTDIKQTGDRYEGVVYEISFAEAPALDGDRTRVTVIYDGPEVVRYNAAGAVVATEPAVRDFEEELHLIRSGTSWLVEEVARP